MRRFADIYARAAARKGGDAALEALIPATRTRAELARIADDRWLSELVRCVFQAGFVWRVVEAKWPAFERAFSSFDPYAVAFLSEDDMDRLLGDASLIRHHAKLRAARDNAAFFLELAAEHGSAAAWFAAWPDDDYVGLLGELKRRASRMGGTSAQYFLRRMGKPAFLLTRDVVRVLVSEGVITKAATSKRDLAAVQAAFNSWAAESGRDLTAISRVLAMSIDD